MTEIVTRALETLFESTRACSPTHDTIRRRFELGRVVTEHRSQRSLRELERALGGRLSRTYLHRCTTAYRLGKSFPFILESQRLRVSHIDAVERLTRPVQCRLLREAERCGWSVRQLRERALAEGTQCHASPAISIAHRALRQLSRSLGSIESQHAVDDATALASLAEIERGLAQAHELSRQLLGREARHQPASGDAGSASEAAAGPDTQRMPVLT